MEENKEIMVNETEEIEAMEPVEEMEEVRNSNSGIGVLGLMALGAAVGIGVYKGAKVVKGKVTSWMEKRASAKTEKAGAEVYDAEYVDYFDSDETSEEK